MLPTPTKLLNISPRPIKWCLSAAKQGLLSTYCIKPAQIVQKPSLPRLISQTGPREWCTHWCNEVCQLQEWKEASVSFPLTSTVPFPWKVLDPSCETAGWNIFRPERGKINRKSFSIIEIENQKRIKTLANQQHQTFCSAWSKLKLRPHTKGEH